MNTGEGNMEQQVCHVSEDEKDILQEIMNIAFGKAAADLAEVINIFVVLNVPRIQVLMGAELSGYLREEISDFSDISIVEQNFRGKFRGSAFLVFPSGAGKELVAMLDADHEETFESGTIDLLEKESLMEVGNILIGACVGKMSELLGDVVTYSPPKVVIENHPNEIIPNNLFDPEYTAIVMKTLFQFDDRNISGFLFLVTTHDSVAWLQQSLARFLEQYE
jgi:chemotaxis protein CheC